MPRRGVMPMARRNEGAPPQRPAAGCVLLNGRVLTTMGTPVRRAHVVVREGRIESILQCTPPVAKARTVVDLAGAYVMPGLIDAHVHVCMDGGARALDQYMSESPSLAALRAMAVL